MTGIIGRTAITARTVTRCAVAVATVGDATEYTVPVRRRRTVVVRRRTVTRSRAVTRTATALLTATARVLTTATVVCIAHDQVTASVTAYALPSAVPTPTRTTGTASVYTRIPNVVHSISIPSCVFEETSYYNICTRAYMRDNRSVFSNRNFDIPR